MIQLSRIVTLHAGITKKPKKVCQIQMIGWI